MSASANESEYYIYTFNIINTTFRIVTFDNPELRNSLIQIFKILQDASNGNTKEIHFRT